MTSKINITEIDVRQLRPNIWNTNVVSPENEDRIAQSIDRFGMFRPIIARQIESVAGYEILGGEHRWKVAQGMGYETIPVINLGYIDDQKAKEISLVDNGRYGEDDTLMLAELLKELGDSADLLSFMPYSEEDLTTILSTSSIAFDDLEIDDSTADLPTISEKAIQTHNIMRFKIPVEDSKFVENMIEAAMKSQNFTDDDSMMNAGNAIIYLLRKIK